MNSRTRTPVVAIAVLLCGGVAACSPAPEEPDAVVESRSPQPCPDVDHEVDDTTLDPICVQLRELIREARARGIGGPSATRCADDGEPVEQVRPPSLPDDHLIPGWADDDPPQTCVPGGACF